MHSLFVIGDVGGPEQFHLGDEAMLEANLLALGRLIPNAEFTVASADPEWTSQRYRVASVKCPFEGPLDKTLAGASGVVVSGGGNLCSTWPEKVTDRISLLEHAQALNLPTVVLGQMIGPHLTADQGRLLSGPLRRCDWVGVRDESSASMALRLGVDPARLHRQMDDAYFLDPLPVEDERVASLGGLPQPWILVTLDPSFASSHRAKTLDVLASQLDNLACSLSASLIFVPHVGGLHGSGDAEAGRALRSKMRADLLLLDPWEQREVVWLTGQAAMVVSARYHPLVFATACGVPALGITVDAYTRTKLHGALASAGVEGWCLSVADVERGALLPLAMELWHQQAGICQRLAAASQQAWHHEKQRWDGILRALRVAPSSADLPAPPAIHVALDGGASSAALISSDQWREYDRNGYLRLGRLLDDGQLSRLGERLDDIMLGRVRYPTLHMQLDTGGAYEDLPDPVAGHSGATLAYRKIQGLEADPLVLELIRRDLFREICARHYGAHVPISIFRVMMMNKPASQGTYLPWHQDAGDVWKLDRDPLVTSWIALDPATRLNGCVQVIPGSHHLGLLSKNGSTLSPEHVEQYCPEDRIEYLELEPGEGLLLHNWLLHRSEVNRTGTPRRALSACYMDGRTLGTLTGTRYPIVFGTHEDTESAMPFLRGLLAESAQLREMAMEAERYARSLLEDNQRREEMRLESERYAKSLEAELKKLRAPRGIPFFR
ncbi:polysaccharide pyruvyl transferase family protein [uncultured Paludibaculum sp.]|uniref:polysaccharide pyruvyl transferase family protein n=1 Tax=uncultured Paludibaculum sp. TaxID=1765020 RepID=UPI002AAC1C35|nr:polysaccharide pyruvyl transferase family protein [uncultured Paludibaculum sp.]